MSWPGVYRDYSRIPYRRRMSAPAGGVPGNFTAVPISVAPQPVTITRQVVLDAVAISVGVQSITIVREVTPDAVAIGVGVQGITVSQPDSGIVPDIGLIIEVAFAPAADVTGYLVIGDPTRGVIDVGKIAPNSVGAIGGVWTDVTQWVRRWSVDAPVSQVDSPIPTYEPSTATIVLDNSGRRFDPDYLGGPYVQNDATQLTPMRGVRIRARWDGTLYELFRGYADSWQVEWMEPGDSETTLMATDAMQALQNNVRAAVAAVGAGEDTGTRIGRILDSAGWASEDRIVSTGSVTCQATTLDGDALTELRLVSDTELGELYLDGSGKVVFRSRAEVEADERSALSQAVFGDYPGELPYLELSTAADASSFYNQVRATAVGGAQQTADDASSQNKFLIRTFERSDLIMDSDAQALTWAQYVLARSASEELFRRFDRLVVDPRVEPLTLYPQVLGRQHGDRITVVRRPMPDRVPTVRDVWVRGMSYQWTETGGLESVSWTLRTAHRTPSAVPPQLSPVRRRAALRRTVRHYRARRPVAPPVRGR